MPGYYYTGAPIVFQNFVEDYWGYYTANPNTSLIPKEYIGSSPDLSTYQGNRNPNPTAMQTYMLNEIDYPTGGKTLFEYEPNQVSDPYFYSYTNSNNGVVGGLRIKTIKDYTDNLADPIIKTYEYDQVGAYQGISDIMFHYQQPYAYYQKDESGALGIGGTVRDIYMSSSICPMTVMDETPLMYSKVTEYTGTSTSNTGKTAFTYEVPSLPNLLSEDIANPKFLGLFEFDRGFPVS